MVTTRPPTPAPSVLREEISAKARLHVVTGKGGTGKTTVAAALAFALANAGKKVLLIEVEGRQAIAQLWDVPALPYEEQRLATTPSGGSLWGLAIDAEQAMIEYLDLFYGLKRSARGLKRMGAVDFVTTLAPGLRDVLLTGKVKEAVTRTNPDGRQAYDVVVLDAPPTGRIGKFLNATREVANLTRFGPINRQSAGVISLLHGKQTVIHLVTLLEEMPVQETLDAAEELSAAGLHLGVVVVNRARPALITGNEPPTGGVDLKLLTAGLRKVNVAAAHAAGLAREMSDYAERQQIQAENSRRLDAVKAPRIELPDLNPPVELGELNELASYFSKQPA
ncbi:MAG: ArsA-related P-loop ATPase [Jatrophihabitantaceae bacterium]